MSDRYELKVIPEKDGYFIAVKDTKTDKFVWEVHSPKADGDGTIRGMLKGRYNLTLERLPRPTLSLFNKGKTTRPIRTTARGV